MLKKLLKSIGLMCTGMVFLGFLFYVVVIPRLESVSFRPGSISALILVDSTIADFPVIAPIAAAEFTYAAGGDGKPKTVTLFYRSKAETDALIEASARYLAALGFKEQPPSADALNYAKGDLRIRFKIEVSPADARHVSVSEIHGPDGDAPGSSRPKGTATVR